MKWREINLGDVIHVKHGFAFKSQYFFNSGEYVVLTPGNFNEEGGFRLRPDKERFYNGDIPEDYVLNDGDLIVAMTEQGPGLLGSSALIPEGGKYLHNQRLGLIQDLDDTIIDKKFLYYLFNTRTVRGQISGSASGTKVRHTAPERIYRVKVIVPADVTEQDRIASILSAYDDLIANNQRRIQLLEQSARLLYKEWFVNLRFPGHEHINIKDGIPEGWEKEKTTSHLEFVRGVEPGSKNYMYTPEESRVPFLRVGDFGSRASNIYIDTIHARGKLLEPEDVAITMDGTPGLVGFGMSGAFSSGIRKVAPKDQCGIGWSFTYELLQSDAIQSTIDSFAKGTTILHASSSLNNMVFLKPPKTLLDLFEVVNAPFLHQILILDNQNDQLTKARDLLLPRLMKGEIAV